MTVPEALTVVAARLAVHTWESAQLAKRLPTVRQNAKDIADTNRDVCETLGVLDLYRADLSSMDR